MRVAGEIPEMGETGVRPGWGRRTRVQEMVMEEGIFRGKDKRIVDGVAGSRGEGWRTEDGMNEGGRGNDGGGGGL